MVSIPILAKLAVSKQYNSRFNVLQYRVPGDQGGPVFFRLEDFFWWSFNVQVDVTICIFNINLYLNMSKFTQNCM